MGTVIVGIIVFGAIGFAGYKMYKNSKSGGCSCGCENCKHSCK